MTEQELFHVLALQQIEGVGDIMAKKLIHHCGSAELVFKTKTSQIAAIDGIGSVLLQKLKDKTVFNKAEQELQFIKSNEINFTYFQDENYPSRLKHCIDGPLLLFTSGNIDLKNKKIISIVGTRQITSYGMEFCRKLMEDLAPLDPVIVSGFAYGVDIFAKFKQELQLISNLDVMLSMDSGNAHLAAMLGVKVITLWGATHPFAGFSPFNQPLENALTADSNLYPKLPTSVYGNKKVAGYESAMRTIPVAEIVSMFQQ